MTPWARQGKLHLRQAPTAGTGRRAEPCFSPTLGRLGWEIN